MSAPLRHSFRGQGRKEVRAALTSSCRAKIARADEHLHALYRETDGWGDGDPLGIVRQSNPDGSEHLFSLVFKARPDVWRWAVLLGDALHNLRCALDHIVYALAINQTGMDPPPGDSQLAFPICSSDDYFDKAVNRISVLNDSTREAIRKAQPYNRIKPGQWFAPIWWLAQLNDIDKHRLSHLIPIAARHDEIRVAAPPGSYRFLWNTGPLIDGAPLLKLTLSEPDPNVYVDLRCTGAVVLEREGFEPIGLHATTQAIRREVMLVCRYLSRFFV